MSLKSKDSPSYNALSVYEGPSESYWRYLERAPQSVKEKFIDDYYDTFRDRFQSRAVAASYLNTLHDKFFKYNLSKHHHYYYNSFYEYKQRYYQKDHFYYPSLY